MPDHVELVALPAPALGVVHGECPIADHPGERDAVVGAEGESVAADGLPGELASGPEPTDVAAQEEFMARCHRIAHPGTDHGIEPVYGPGAGERPGFGDLEVADVDGTRDVKREVRRLMPVAGATEDIEGQRPRACDLVGGTDLNRSAPLAERSRAILPGSRR
jgi:hypothetical protein